MSIYWKIKSIDNDMFAFIDIEKFVSSLEIGDMTYLDELKEEIGLEAGVSHDVMIVTNKVPELKQDGEYVKVDFGEFKVGVTGKVDVVSDWLFKYDEFELTMNI